MELLPLMEEIKKLEYGIFNIDNIDKFYIC